MSFNKDRLIALRTEKKQSVGRVAWQTIIDHAVLKRIEEGERKNPRIYTIKTLAVYYDVPIDTFRKGADISECLFLIAKS